MMTAFENQNQLAKSTDWDKLQLVSRRKQVEHLEIAGIEAFPYRKDETAFVVFSGTIKGYIPFSESGLSDPNSMFSMILSKVPVLIDDMNRSQGVLLYSITKAKCRLAAETLKSIKAGDVVNAFVQRISRERVRVEIGGLDAVIPRKELSWQFVESASDVVKLGEEIRVKVLEIKEDGSIVVSKKAAQEDPWVKMAAQIQVGQAYGAEVTGKHGNGIFLKLPNGVSAMAASRRVLEKGQRAVVQVTDIDVNRKRVSCSILRSIG